MDEDEQRHESVLTMCVCNLIVLLKMARDNASACVYIHLSANGVAPCELPLTALSETASWLSKSLTTCGTLGCFKDDQILLTPNLTALHLQEWIHLSGLMGTQLLSVSVKNTSLVSH